MLTALTRAIRTKHTIVWLCGHLRRRSEACSIFAAPGGPHLSANDAWPRDVLGVGLIVLLAVILLPAWGIDLSPAGFTTGTATEKADHLRDLLNSVVDILTSFYLLPAMGLCLALRHRVIDASVWVTAGLGGVLAGAAINAGFSPAWAFIAAAVAGLVVGAINGAIVVCTRVPSVVATLVTACAIMWAAQGLVRDKAIQVPEETFDGWRLTQEVMRDNDAPLSAKAPGALPHDTSVTETIAYPLVVTRMLLVGGSYSAAMLVLVGLGMAARHHKRLNQAVRGRVLAAMCASGALSAAAGAFWLMEHGQAPVPTRPVDDLLMPAAAILAGSAFFVGRGRTLLAGLCLPTCLLLTAIWRQEVLGVQRLEAHGYAPQVALLMAMVLSAHLALGGVISARGPRRVLSGAGAGLVVAGLVVVAAEARVASHPTRTALHATGIAVWLVGVLALAVARVWKRRHREPST